MEKIGLEAILEIAGFSRAAAKYKNILEGMGKAGEALGLDAAKVSGAIDTLVPIMGAAGIAATGASYALDGLKQAFEFGKEGALITQTEQSFNNLMVKFGAAPDILEQMSAATLGTVDDMTLMNGTMTMLAGVSDDLGRSMVEAAPKLLEISKAAVKLKPSLGDVSHVYESLTLGIKRNSPMLIDNANIMVKVGEANQRYADEAGITVEAMTAEDKQMALLEETLRAGSVMLNQVNGDTSALGDEFKNIETDITNLTNKLKKDAYPAFRDILNIIGLFLDMNEDLDEALKKLPGDIDRASIVMPGLGNALKYIEGRSNKLTEATGELGEAEKDVTYFTKEMAEEMIEAEPAADNLAKAQKGLEEALGDVAKAYESAFGELSKGIIDLRDLGKAANESAKDYDKAVKDLNKSTAKSLKDVRDNFTASLPERTTVKDRLGMAEDAWDEWGLRLQAIIEGGIASPWYQTLQEMGYSKPPDVGIRAWAEDLQDQFYKGRLPDLLPPEWAEKVRQQQQEATAAVQAETAKRRAEMEKARQEELAAQEQARKDTLIEIALGMAEAGGLLAQWSEQRFGFAGVGDSANEVLRMIESGAIEIDQNLQTIIGDMLAGVNTAFEETGRIVEENQGKLDEVLDPSWVDQRRGTMATLGEVIYEETNNVFDPMLQNFYGVESNIMTSATNMVLGLGTQFGIAEQEWNTTVGSMVRSWNTGTSKINRAIQKKVIEKLNEIPRTITVTVNVQESDTEGRQHGGAVPAGIPVMVGEGGPEMFVPEQPGTVIPNWRMNVPALLGAMSGPAGGATVGAPVQITMNPVINSGMDMAEFQARTLLTVQQALRGA